MLAFRQPNPRQRPVPADEVSPTRLAQRLPGLQLLRRYPAGWWRHDIVAGLVLTTMLVPVGIAYAVASGVPGIHGLYATIAALLAYAAVRAEPHPGAGAGFVTGGADPRRWCCRCRAATGSARWRWPARWRWSSGVVCVVAGLARLGFVTELLSKPIRYGYMNGIALAVIVSQLPKLCGIKIEGDGPLAQAVGLRAGAARRPGQPRRRSRSASPRWR